MKSCSVVLCLLATLTGAAFAADAPLTLATVNDVEAVSVAGQKPSAIATLRAQVLLERAWFSAGEIDAKDGSNTRKAITAWQAHRGLDPTGNLDAASWALLNENQLAVLVNYTITASDVAGPFVKLPPDMMEKAKRDTLGYESAAEALAEKFHLSPALLERLNPDADFNAVGAVLTVPAVEPTKALPTVAKIVVDRSDSALTVFDAQGALLAYFPASTGSKHDPLPVGEWRVLGVANNPEFQYNPKLFWDANPAHAKARIPPGPNNPVGVAWIDLSKEHYGIHGTPAPSRVGKSQSHGCIRLTNWSVRAVADMVAPGVVAILQE